MNQLSPYPEEERARDRWILERRGPRRVVEAERPYAFLVEPEHFANGQTGNVATIFLTNKECPWRCAMCDLWRDTLAVSVPPGAIPKQIAYALDLLPPASQVKLYNSGSFFDHRAIRLEDYAPIATLVSHFDRVIVESHPALVGDSCLRFAETISGTLEVAMGLETAHPEALTKLNKRMTLEQYHAAAERLRTHGIALRTFLLIQPPFLAPSESFYWACRSIDCAFDAGATAVTLIPTRKGNGAIDDLERLGHYTPHSLAAMEDALDYGLSQQRGRVFVDLWDTTQVTSCVVCRGARLQRLRDMNLSQVITRRLVCASCGGAG